MTRDIGKGGKKWIWNLFHHLMPVEFLSKWWSIKVETTFGTCLSEKTPIFMIYFPLGSSVIGQHHGLGVPVDEWPKSVWLDRVGKKEGQSWMMALGARTSCGSETIARLVGPPLDLRISSSPNLFQHHPDDMWLWEFFLYPSSLQNYDAFASHPKQNYKLLFYAFRIYGDFLVFFFLEKWSLYGSHAA